LISFGIAGLPPRQHRHRGSANLRLGIGREGGFGIGAGDCRIAMT